MKTHNTTKRYKGTHRTAEYNYNGTGICIGNMRNSWVL